MKSFAITREIIDRLNTFIDAGLSHGLGVQEPGKMCVEAAVCAALGLPHSDDPKCVAKSVRACKIGLNDKRWSSNKARGEGLRRLAIAQLGTSENFDEKFFIEELVCATIRLVKQRYKEPQWTLWADNYLNGSNRTQTAAAAAATNAAAAAATYVAKAAARAAAYATNAAAYAADAAAYAAADAAAYSAYAAAADAAAYTAAAAVAADAAANAAYAADAAAYAAANAAAAAANAAYAADAAAYAAANAAAAAANAAYDKVLADFAEEVVQILIKMETPGSKWL